ncbi:MAG TPA: radical SAM family heme chaperone HemW [Pyrinomonadaceae bacterium]|jgi:oxygen-independent coproporphyrinogen-3 oxidase
MSRAGIYVHIPFCRSRCSYCDFATGAYEGALAERYVRALVDEIERFHPTHDNTRFPLPHEADTIYFGGGTPSLLAPAQLATILDALQRNFRITPDAELTLEMNPGTVTPEVLSEFRRLGINRASFGAQTFDDRELARLGRTHTADDARRTLRDLRAAGFDNISFDLIAGLPEQSLAAWSRNLEEALALRPAHLSLYLLEVHEATPLAEHIKRGMWRAPDPDTAAEMYRLLVERAEAAGYEQYEISNFCLPGYESRHNVKYWTGAPYYGFGSSAHSFDGDSLRWSNERDAARYTQLVEEGQSPVVETTQLDEQDASAESLFLGLRLARGVSLEAHRARFGRDVRELYRDELERFSEAGLIELCGDTLRLTREGALLSNEVFAAFV